MKLHDVTVHTDMLMAHGFNGTFTNVLNIHAAFFMLYKP